MKKRKYEDKRDWKLYNRQLVKRGEFYINPRFLSTWNKEIRQLNAGKVGQPYLYPNSMIEFLGIMQTKGFDCRSLEGVMHALSKNTVRFPVISYSQINRRINALNLDFSSHNNEQLVVGEDGSGIKVSNRGEWMREQWKVRRGWIKVVIMGTPDGKIVDIRVGNEKLDERAAVRGMLRSNKEKVKKAILDGYHDCRKTFDLCDQLGIEPVIKIRKGASTRARGSPARKREVLKYKELGYRGWCKSSSYGLRWPATEGLYSSVKRMFGEHVRSVKKRNMYREAKRKFWAYNKALDYGRS